MTSSKIPKPRISVVIVNWNTSKLLENCLSSIYKENSPGLLEVIVIDNASSDKSCEMVHRLFPKVILIENTENLGFAKATNQGFEIASCEYVLMLNSDTVILDRALEKTLEFADSHPDYAVIGCKLIYPDGRFQNSCSRFPNIIGIFLESIYLSQLFKNSYILNRDRYGNHDRNWTSTKHVDCVMGSFMFIRNSVLQKIGYLDTDYFMYAEEVDFAYRVKKAGYYTVYFPGAQIIHVHSGSQKTWKDAAWSYKSVYRGIFFFLYKWHPVKAYICNLIFVLFLIPRLFIWAFFDILSWLTHIKEFKIQHLHKVSVFVFHTKAVIYPVLFKRKWNR